MIAIDLTISLPLNINYINANIKAIKQIRFIGNLDRVRITTIFVNFEGVKEIILDFSQDNEKVLEMHLIE